MHACQHIQCIQHSSNYSMHAWLWMQKIQLTQCVAYNRIDTIQVFIAWIPEKLLRQTKFFTIGLNDRLCYSGSVDHWPDLINIWKVLLNSHYLHCTNLVIYAPVLNVCRWIHADEFMQMNSCRWIHADEFMQMNSCRWIHADEFMQMSSHKMLRCASKWFTNSPKMDDPWKLFSTLKIIFNLKNYFYSYKLFLFIQLYLFIKPFLISKYFEI